MLENHKQFCFKKGYEISYALFRLTAVLGHPKFADHLEDQALQLIKAVISDNYSGSKGSLKVIEFIIRLGADVGLVSQKNSQSIINAANELNAAINQIEAGNNQAKDAAIDLGAYFVVQPIINKPANLTKNAAIDNQNNQVTQEKAIIPHNNSGDEEAGGANNGMNAIMRQSLILNRIRQNNTCRFKDLQELLPNISERTLRYDIQGLCGQELIERIGTTGPASFYQVKSSPN